MIKAAASNRLVGSPAYAKILHQYNEVLARDGKVNNKKFYEEVVLPELPGYHLQSWYQFLKRFKTNAGLVQAIIADRSVIPSEINRDTENQLTSLFVSNNEATSKGIAMALNIGMETLRKVLENPEDLSNKERIELLFKAMKAQDSRIHAVKSIKEDNREQEKFDRTFDAGIYSS